MTGCKFDNDRHVNPPFSPLPFSPPRQVQAGTWLVTGLPVRGPSPCVSVCVNACSLDQEKRKLIVVGGGWLEQQSEKEANVDKRQIIKMYSGDIRTKYLLVVPQNFRIKVFNFVSSNVLMTTFNIVIAKCN